MKEYDVIQVGAGVNGLIVAAYLAKAGLNVCILEKQDIIGGGALTRENSAPGFKDDVASITHAYIQLNPLISNDELGLLSKYGLKYIFPEKCITVIFPDHRSLSIYRDVDKTCESIEKFSRKDADAYHKFYDWSNPLVETMVMGMYNPPSPFGAMMSMLEQSEEGRELIRVLQTSAKFILDEWFESDAMKVTGSRLVAEHLIPFDQMGTGSGFFFMIPIAHRVGHTLAEGGAGALPLALGRCIKDLGGTIQTSCGVKKFITKGGECKGVITEAGEEIQAKRLVVSNLNIKQYPRMIDESLPAEFMRGIRRVRASAYTGFKVDFALNSAIEWKAKEANDSFLVFPVNTYSPDYEQERCHKLFRGFTFTNEPLTACQTVFDPTRAPNGKHTLYTGTFEPSCPREGGVEIWDEIKEEIADGILQEIRNYSTNMGDKNIIGKHITSPLDFERMNDAWPGGEALHIGEWADQLMQSRPFLGWNYKSPIAKLYMCGSSNDPVPGVTGCGRATAMVIMEDLGIDFESVIK